MDSNHQFREGAVGIRKFSRCRLFRLLRLSRSCIHISARGPPWFSLLLLPANTPARPGRYSRGGGTRRRNGAAPDAADDRPHRQSPSCGKRAAYDKSLRVERHDATPALDLRKSPKPAAGLFHLPTGPGLGLQINEAELAKRRSRNYPAPENRGDECDGCFKVRLGNQ